MRALLASLLCLWLLSCSGSGTMPLDADTVRAQLISELGLMAEGLNHEDPFLASQPVSERFVMGSNISIRFRDAAWDGTGIGPFRAFFQSVFDLHDNILITFTLKKLFLSGTVATARVQVDFSSLRIDRVPPENVTASAEDYLVFEFTGGQWLLLRWDEAPPHDEGLGEDV